MTLATARRAPARLHAPDLAVLRVWALSRLPIFLLAAVAGQAFPRFPDRPTVPYLERFRIWDVVHFQHIAAQGYGGDPKGNLVAFFPGLPLLLRGVHSLGIGYTAAGLLVSLVAGALGVIAVGRIAELDGPPGAGERAVLLLVLAPAAVFLAVPYTEALFLGLAAPAWLAARRGRWALAGCLGAAASTVRVSGLFLAAGLMVAFFCWGGRRRRTDGAWLVLPFLPVVAYGAFLRVTTGDWLAWVHAQQHGWYRKLTDPVAAFVRTWHSAFGGHQIPQVEWVFRLELIAMAAGIAGTVWLVRRRLWPEATYVGLSVTALATSTWYFSVPRAALLWFPLWVALAQATLRRPALLTAYLLGSAPVMAVLTLFFTSGRWAG